MAVMVSVRGGLESMATIQLGSAQLEWEDR